MTPYEINAPIDPLSEAPLYQITFQPDEKDYITSREDAIDKDYSARSSGMSQVMLIILIYAVIAVLIVGVLSLSQESILNFASGIVYIVLLGTAVTVYWAVHHFLQKRKVKKAARTSAVESGAVNTPIQLSFYRDRLQLSNRLTNSEYLYADITVHETAEGLSFLVYGDVVCYVPARFFDQNTAFQITSFLQQVREVRYQREAYMQVGQTAQPVAEVTQDEAPLYEFHFVTERRDTRPIAMRDAWQSILLFVLGFGGAMLLTYLLGKYLWRMFYVATVTIGGLFAAMVIGMIYGMLAWLFKKDFPQAIYQKYFDDRVKITVGSEENTVPYDKIKKVSFFRDSVVIDTKNGKWQYIPKSQFVSEEKAQEFVKFLQARIS